MTVSLWQQTSVARPFECDVCILGAGIAGASLAYWLRVRQPNLKVCVVEAREIGAGASGRNAGMILAGLADHYDLMVTNFGRERAREIWAATLDHARHVYRFAETSNVDFGLERKGSWRVGLEPQEQTHLERSHQLLCEDGFKSSYSSADAMGRGFYGTLAIESDGACHPVRLVEALLAYSQASVHQHCEAFALRDTGGGRIKVHTRGGDFIASRVFVALNAYAPLFHHHFAALVTPHRGQICVTAPLEKQILTRPVYTHHGYIYFRQLADQRLLLGGWRHEYAAREAGYADATTSEVQNRLDEFLAARFPEAAQVDVPHRWSGTMGFAPDGLPSIGELKDFEVARNPSLSDAPRLIPDDASHTETNSLVISADEFDRLYTSVTGASRVCFALGFTGHGFGLSMEVARRAVAAMFDNEPVGVFDVVRLKSTLDC